MEEELPIRIYLMRSKGPKNTSSKKFKRDLFKENPICYLCDKKFSLEEFDLEHFIPPGVGGSVFNKTNVRLCCTECHDKKTGMDKRINTFFRDMGFIEKIGQELTINIPLEKLHRLYIFLFELSLTAKVSKEKYKDWQSGGIALKFQDWNDKKV